MTNYQIFARKQSHRLTEDHGIVIASTIEFLEGLPWTTALPLLQQKSWTVVAEIDPVNVFEFKGRDYVLQWHGQRITHITRDGEEISWNQLPEQLKGLL